MAIQSPSGVPSRWPLVQCSNQALTNGSETEIQSVVGRVEQVRALPCYACKTHHCMTTPRLMGGPGRHIAVWIHQGETTFMLGGAGIASSGSSVCERT